MLLTLANDKLKTHKTGEAVGSSEGLLTLNN